MARPPVNKHLLWLLLGFSAILVTAKDKEDSEEDKVVHTPTPCEVCRIFAHEMDARMKETFKKKTLDVSSKPFTADSRKIDYSKSELRLIEVLDGVCEKISDYRVHTKDGMQRYAKQESETVDTLQGLRKRGVKVDIGLPWDIVEKSPKKEIMALKRKCEALAEDFEDELTAWYFRKQEEPLLDYFCRGTILQGEDQSCLTEPWEPFGLPYSDGGGVDPKRSESVKPIPKKDEL